jgi:hypothetical protein
MEELTRRQVRYICFRLLQEADGGNKAKGIKFLDEVKDHLEDEENFGGWDKFGKTWDVDEKAPLVAVLRKTSIASEWTKVLKKEAHDLPVAKEIEKEVKEIQAKE